MKASELYDMMSAMESYERQDLADYKLVGPDGRVISGVHIDKEKKKILMLQRAKRVEKRVDL